MATDEIVIELGTDLNQTQEFPPLLDFYRGRFTREGLGTGANSNKTDLLSLPVIPGVMVSLSIARKCGRVFDPLDEPENKELATRIDAMCTKGFPNGGPLKRQPEVRRPKLSDDEVATWLHWMKRLVAERKALLVSGSLDREVKGRIELDPYSRGVKGAPVYADEFEELLGYPLVPAACE